MQHPLDGVKVIEIAAFGPAMKSSQSLGDLGADVIVVEPPANRALGPEWSAGDRFRPEMNRNKRGIGLDLRQPEGQKVLHELVKNADVLIEANRPGVAKRLGYDYPTLEAINPRIIMCSVTGYGQEGPYRSIPGHGLVWEATAGWLLMHGQGWGNMGGDYTGRPWVNYFNLPDTRTLVTPLASILAALYAREKTGAGQFIDIAIVDSVVAVRQSNVPEMGDGAFRRHTAGWNVYECKDGRYIATAAGEAIQWANLCEGLGLPELAKENRVRGERGDEIIAILEQRFKTKTRDEWFEVLSKLDTEVARVNTIDEAMEDPQIKLRGMHVEVTDDAGYRDVQYGSPFKLTKTPPRTTHRRAPRLGEHTDMVMAELGYGPEEIARLGESGAIIRRRHD